MWPTRSPKFRNIRQWPSAGWVLWAWRSHTCGNGLGALCSTSERIYPALRNARGFDALDDHILDDVLGLGEDATKRRSYVSLVQRCAETALDALRHEEIEPQSPLAFHAYVRSLHTLYRIGAALELRRLGYHFEKVD